MLFFSSPATHGTSIVLVHVSLIKIGGSIGLNNHRETKGHTKGWAWSEEGGTIRIKWPTRKLVNHWCQLVILRNIQILGYQIRGPVPVIACRHVNSSLSIVNMTTGLCCLYMLKVNKGIYVLMLFLQGKCIVSFLLTRIKQVMYWRNKCLSVTLVCMWREFFLFVVVVVPLYPSSECDYNIPLILFWWHVMLFSLQQFVNVTCMSDIFCHLIFN
jgi:hypothetical protein